MKKTIQVLKPTYYDKFHCIGGACEMNCCDRDWKITIDKKSYLKFRNIKNPEIKARMDNFVKRNRDSKVNEYSYGLLVKDEHGNCPFHMESGLCMMHRDLGEEFLCITCKKYPRLMSLMREATYEHALSMSCPEAVRIALFDIEPMGFELTEMEMTNQELLALRMVNSDAKWNSSGFVPHGWALREASIDIMQTREYSVERRLLIIGMLMRRVAELGKEEKWDEIPQTIALFQGGAMAGDFHKMPNYALEDILKRQIRGVFCGVLAGLSERPTNLYEVFKEAVQACQAETTRKQQEEFGDLTIEMVYTQKKEVFWPGFLARRSHVLENYFVNLFFSKLFPLDVTDEIDPYQCFCLVAVQFALLRILLCTLSVDGVLEDAKLVRAIASTAVMGENGSDFKYIFREVYKKMQIESLAHMYFTVLDN